MPFFLGLKVLFIIFRQEKYKLKGKISGGAKVKVTFQVSGQATVYAFYFHLILCIFFILTCDLTFDLYFNAV